ncbi:cupin domain-containing protein [Bacteroides sp. 51]|uniref:cupin domain-containing protein n=1 Tax=Bacteroides sp. 51 TaxID=2302938 RepID=UPI0013D4393E|nr:cupin domain-containing protein [Bacteroides sp. 51]NDV80727.1 cupin domain-containing protein [Bacteroides sp. 51]
MKQIEKISENNNYTAIDIGNLDELVNYSFIHPKTGKEVKGKVFLKEPTNSTGTEISFTTIPPKAELGYFHFHNKDEETYIILKGAGYYQVDGDCFPIKEGSVIRVAPKGIRGLCNTSEDPMVYLCVQSKANSLEEHTTDNGGRIEAIPQWEKFR